MNKITPIVEHKTNLKFGSQRLSLPEYFDNLHLVVVLNFISPFYISQSFIMLDSTIPCDLLKSYTRFVHFNH